MSRTPYLDGDGPANRDVGLVASPGALDEQTQLLRDVTAGPAGSTGPPPRFERGDDIGLVSPHATGSRIPRPARVLDVLSRDSFQAYGVYLVTWPFPDRYEDDAVVIKIFKTAEHLSDWTGVNGGKEPLWKRYLKVEADCLRTLEKSSAARYAPELIGEHIPDDDDSLPYLAMTYVDAPTLRSQILRDVFAPGALDRDQRLYQLTRGLLRWLTELHRGGHAHRDIHGRNVLVRLHDNDLDVIGVDYANAFLSQAEGTRNTLEAGDPAFQHPARRSRQARQKALSEVEAGGRATAAQYLRAIDLYGAGVCVVVAASGENSDMLGDVNHSVDLKSSLPAWLRAVIDSITPTTADDWHTCPSSEDVLARLEAAWRAHLEANQQVRTGVRVWAIGAVAALVSEAARRTAAPETLGPVIGALQQYVKASFQPWERHLVDQRPMLDPADVVGVPKSVPSARRERAAALLEPVSRHALAVVEAALGSRAFVGSAVPRDLSAEELHRAAQTPCELEDEFADDVFRLAEYLDERRQPPPRRRGRQLALVAAVLLAAAGAGVGYDALSRPGSSGTAASTLGQQPAPTPTPSRTPTSTTEARLLPGPIDDVARVTTAANNYAHWTKIPYPKVAVPGARTSDGKISLASVQLRWTNVSASAQRMAPSPTNGLRLLVAMPGTPTSWRSSWTGAQAVAAAPLEVNLGQATPKDAGHTLRVWAFAPNPSGYRQSYGTGAASWTCSGLVGPAETAPPCTYTFQWTGDAGRVLGVGWVTATSNRTYIGQVHGWHGITASPVSASAARHPNASSGGSGSSYVDPTTSDTYYNPSLDPGYDPTITDPGAGTATGTAASSCDTSSSSQSSSSSTTSTTSSSNDPNATASGSASASGSSAGSGSASCSTSTSP